MIFDPGTKKLKKVKKIRNLNFKNFKVINITREPLPREWVEAGYMDRKFIYKYTIVYTNKKLLKSMNKWEEGGVKVSSWIGANNLTQLKEYFKRL